MRLMIDQTVEDWKTYVAAQGWPAYRAGQIQQWLSRGIGSIAEMTNLPKNIREQLAADFLVDGLTVERKSYPRWTRQPNMSSACLTATVSNRS